MIHGCCVDRKFYEKHGSGPKGCDERTCMQLPEGKTCGDCMSLKACLELGVTTETQDSCDWFPRVFCEKPESA